jgi:hypothetical protein
MTMAITVHLDMTPYIYDVSGGPVSSMISLDYPEHESGGFVRNVGTYLPFYTEPHAQ